MNDAASAPPPSRGMSSSASLDPSIVTEVGETSTCVIDVHEPELLKSLDCEFVSDLSYVKPETSVEKKGPNQYEINFQPTIKGRHRLHIKINSQHVRGSPFCVVAKSPVAQLNKPILTINGVRKPEGIAISRHGDMVVTEKEGYCISVISTRGGSVRSFGTRGSGQGQFGRLGGVALDSEGNVLVVDGGNHRIQKFTIEGQFLAAAGSEGDGPLQFDTPFSITFNSYNNKVYVVDYRCVQILNADLTFSSTFGKGCFKNPSGIACDNTGNVFVADGDNHHVRGFTADGNPTFTFGTLGQEIGELAFPVGIAVDGNGFMYVSERDNLRVSVFTADGRYFVTMFGTKGEGPGEFSEPRGLTVDEHGVVYICDENNRIVLF